MPKLSVIVPVYNVEAYLPECIESILNQSMQELELILIDDGSSDNCGKICDVYSEKDGRIRVIHQRNQGVSAARNAGIRISVGEYLGFVDPDDFVDLNMFEELISEVESNSCDIAICGFTNCTEDGIFINESAVPTGIYSKEDLILSIYGMPNPFHGSMCNKIFSREILDGLAFDENVAIGEDWLLLYECYQNADMAVAVSECLYTVRIRNNSATRKRRASVYISKLETYLKLYRYSNNQSKKIQRKATAKILDSCYMNKNAIMEQDYDRKSISFINRQLRKISISAFLCGNLSLKRAVYYFIKGLQY